MMRWALLAILLLLSRLDSAWAQTEPPRPPSPAEALAKLTVAQGLEVRLVAAEPLVRKPLSLSFDERGRLWVLQYLQYPIPNGLKPVEVDQYLRTKYDRVPEPPPKGPKGRDRITILEDTNGDGVADRSTNFLTELNLASGFALGYDGVFVVQPPYLLYYADKNRDDVPDGPPDVLLRGFGTDDAHAFANSLTWGPDGWLYGAQGSTVTAQIRGIEFQQGIWRYHPRTREFELFAEGGGNTWGIDFDRYGRLFAGGNTVEPLCHHVQGAYYVKGFGKHGPLHNPYSFGYFPPVKHVGFLGSALTGGCVIYQGGLFPERYNNAVIYPNLRVNAIRTARLEPLGSTFATHYLEDFITSTDTWFRAVDNLVGPDGSLFIADWCDDRIAHANQKDVSQWYIPNGETGRIWRVVPTGTTPLVKGPLPTRLESNAQLVGLLDHPNAWFSREALRILAERRDPTVCPQLEKLIFSASDETLALKALWALEVSDGLSDAVASRLLEHPSEHLRSWTIRLLGDRRQLPGGIGEKLVDLARREPSVTVRSQLACTCKRLSATAALPIIEQLCQRAEDVDDPHIPLLLWWAIEDKAITDRALVLERFGTKAAWNQPLTRGVIVERLVRRYLAEGQPADYLACARMLADAPQASDRERLVQALEQQMAGRSFEQAPSELSGPLTTLLATSEPSSALVRLGLRMGLDSAAPVAVARAADARLPAAERVEFIRALRDLKPQGSLAALLTLLESDPSAQIQDAALQALQGFDDPAVPNTILARYEALTPALRDRARDILTSRPNWSAQLLVEVEAAKIAAKDFSIEQVRRIVLHELPELNQRVEKLWGQVQPKTSREKEGRITAVGRILGKGPGDAAKGKPLFVKHCANCHQLFGEGLKVGPDLSGVDRKNLGILLHNVFDPSAILREGYQQYVVSTVDGLVLTGLLAESTPESVTILDAKNVRTVIPRGKVDEMKASAASLMPEGILDTASEQELRDLFQYLRSDPEQPAAPK